MGYSVDLYKLNFKKFVAKLMENPKINNKELLEKIILQFGNKVGEDLVILENEFFEEAVSTWEMANMIGEVFNLTEKEQYEYDEIFYDLSEDLIANKHREDAYENLGLYKSDRELKKE